MTAIKTLLLANGWVYSVSELPKNTFFKLRWPWKQVGGGFNSPKALIHCGIAPAYILYKTSVSSNYTSLGKFVLIVQQNVDVDTV